MRGRVLILLGLIVLGAVAVGAILVLGGGDDDTPDTVGEGTIDPNATNEPGGNNTPATQPPVVPVGNTNFVVVVIAAQNIGRGTQITLDSLSSSGSPDFDITWSSIAVPDGFNFESERVIELTSASEQELDAELTLKMNGCYTRTDIPRGTPILRSQLTRSPFSATTECPIASGLSRTGSDAALFMPENRVAISVPLDPTGIGQVAYVFQPGDHLDVIMSFLFIEVDEDFQTRTPNTITIITRLEDGTIGFTEGREGEAIPSPIFPDGVVEGPSEDQQRPRLVTQRTILNAEVVLVGWFPSDGRIYGATPTLVQPTPDPLNTTEQGAVATIISASPTAYGPVIMTISVTPQEAVMLTWAIDAQIPITYALRSANALPPEQGGEINEQTEAVTLEYITDLFEIQEPPRLGISVEPAITDIRRFDLSSLRTFSDLIITE
jgi:Flp pilus assembly protein CpaB